MLGAGALAVVTIAVLGVASFYSLPNAEVDPVVTREAVFDFLLILGPLCAGIIAIAGASAYIGAGGVSGDVEFVARRVRAIAQRGDLGEPVAIRALDEVGLLTRSFEELRQGYLEQLARDREARRQAQEADRIKSEFLDSVSHELRTPLNAILGFTQVLLAELEGPLSEGQREDLSMIQASGEHLLELFNNVLDLSALASGRIELNLSEVDPGQLLHEAASLLEAQREGKDVRIRREVSAQVPKVTADPTRLRQIVMNLGSNAVKFTRQGEVRLRAVQHQDELWIEVHDTGVGIAPSELSSIFEEFIQGGTSKERRRGSGLGLSICKQLTELHGGRIWAESELGEGSVFTVALPLAGPREESSA